MTPVHRTDVVHGSIEGALRQAGPAQPEDRAREGPADRAAPEATGARPGVAPAQDEDRGLILYGRLGYVRRDLTRLDARDHQRPPLGF